MQENSLIAVSPEGVPILLAKKDGQIYALSDKCAHMGCQLSNGILEGYIIRCPCHYWRYDIRTGEFLDAREIRLPTYEWKLSDGKIFIKIGEESQ